MQLAKKLCLYAVMTIGLCAVVWFGSVPPPVSAVDISTANPFCWGELEVDCSAPTNVNFIKAATGGPPRVGRCYAMGFGVTEYAYTDPVCVDARTDMAIIGSQDPRCYALRGEDINNYYGGRFNPANLDTINCNDPAIKSLFAASQSGFRYLPGYCYVVANEFKTTSVQCTTHDSRVANAHNNPAPPPVSSPGGGSVPGVDVGALPTTAPKNDCQDGLTPANCGITRWLKVIINILSAVVGVVIVGVLVFAGIEYTTSGDDPQKVGKAKTRIANAVLALAVYIFGFAFLQWIVPGGIL